MKTLYESILDDEDDILDNQDLAIREWILLNYMKDGWGTLTEDLNLTIHDGIVDAPDDDLIANGLLESLTNGQFVFGIVRSFNCGSCKKLKSLEGAPRKCIWEFRCTGCKELTSLEGGPDEALVYNCSYCENLTSLRGCPKIVYNFKANGIGITSLEGGPEYIKKDPHHGTTFEIMNCEKLKSIDGNLKKIIGQVWIKFDNCINLKNIEALSKVDFDPESYISVYGCKKLKSLKGCPKKLFRLNADDCKSIISLEGGPEICGSYNVNNCTKLTSLKGAPKILGGSLFAMNCRNLKDISNIKDIEWTEHYSRLYIKNSNNVELEEIPMDIRKNRIGFNY